MTDIGGIQFITSSSLHVLTGGPFVVDIQPSDIEGVTRIEVKDPRSNRSFITIDIPGRSLVVRDLRVSPPTERKV